MRQSDLLKLPICKLIYPDTLIEDFKIKGLHYNSRECKEGYLFFATDGTHTDGHNYIEDAIANGATTIVVSHPLNNYNSKAIYIMVDSPRRAMSLVASSFYGEPQKKLHVVGVTGTDGKSSTVSLVSQLLDLAGATSGFISTVEFKAGNEIYPNPYRQSTPEAVELYQILKQIMESKSDYAVIEATSHALSPKNNRLGDIQFDAAIFTNVTQEHLEFHKTLKQYRKDKSQLFKQIKVGGFGVVNGDDKNHKLFVKATKEKVISYSLNRRNFKKVDCQVRVEKLLATSSSFTIDYNGESYKATIKLPSKFNIANTVAAYLTVINLLKLNHDQIKELTKKLTLLKPINGRMNTIDNDLDLNLIIDYAHTPGAFKQLFPSIKKQTEGQIISLFGSGGERDTKKRPIQGAIADKYSNIIILTDEDPRLEDSMEIINQIAKGCKKAKKRNQLYLIPNRKEAIEFALTIAQPKDTILFLGKGHESCIITKEGKRPWSEHQVVKEALTKRATKK